MLKHEKPKTDINYQLSLLRTVSNTDSKYFLWVLVKVQKMV